MTDDIEFDTTVDNMLLHAARADRIREAAQWMKEHERELPDPFYPALRVAS